MSAALLRHDEVVRNAITRQGGTWFKHTGDGACATFDDAFAAAETASAIQSALRDDELLTPRIGIHSGPAEERGGDWFGPSLNRCARLMSAAHGGQTVVSGDVAALLDGRIGLRDLGEHRLRDLRAPLHVFQLGGDEFPALRSLSTTPTNLPIQRSSFVGRASELSSLDASLRNVRLLTLTGVGGVGKTRLAIQAAAEASGRYPDGTFLVELGPVRDPLRISRVVAEAVGAFDTLVEAQITDVAAAAAATLDRLAAWVARRQVLIVLDNCEHLIGGAARLVDRLLSVGDGVTVLATSREPLMVAGENVVPVGGLDDAIRLFEDRCQAMKPTFQVTPEIRGRVEGICTRLDGIPLAIELAASRISALSVAQIDERLADAFGLLRSGSRTALDRHQTLAATMRWSYDLLTSEEQHLFRRLGVFVDGCTLDAIERVCLAAPLESDPLDTVQQLVDKSLLLFEDAPTSGRYRMLEVVGQFARGLLEASGESDAARDRHLAWAADLAQPAASALTVNWAYRPVLAPEHNNLRRAFSWAVESGQSTTALRLATATAAYWRSLGLAAIAREWLDQALLMDDLDDPFLSALAFVSLVNMASLGGDYSTAITDFDTAAENFERIGVELGVAYCLFGKARALDITGRFDDATPVLAEALSIFERLGDRVGHAWATFNRAWVLFVRGDTDGAANLSRPLLTGDRVDVGVEPHSVALVLVGLHEMLSGNIDAGRDRYVEGLELTRANFVEHSYASYLAASVELELDDGQARGTALLHASLDEGKAAGALELLEGQLTAAAVVAARHHRLADAAALMAAAGTIRSRTGIVVAGREGWKPAREALSAVRSALDARELDTATSLGQSWTLSEAADAAITLLASTAADPPVG